MKTRATSSLSAYPLSLLCLLLIVLSSCSRPVEEKVVEVQTMGTWGTIKYVGDFPENQAEKKIDSILREVNLSLSTYIDSSCLSQFNAVDSGPVYVDQHFLKVFNQSLDIMEWTQQAFNPQIYPLVNYYGFGHEQETILDIDTAYVTSLVETINTPLNERVFYIDQISSEDMAYVYKSTSYALDFSAIAKGYGVDVISHFLEHQSIDHYMVEIGGEVRCKGNNVKGEIWKIGIEEPNEESRSIFDVVQLQDASMASSGNYRNVKVLESGQKVVHIINPRTGFPEISNLLSASIVSKDCMTADALATACMVMGKEQCLECINGLEEVECYLIYSDESGTLQKEFSEGFEKYLLK